MNVSTEEMQRLLSAELSVRARVAYTALLLVALGMTIVIASLWITEPAIVARTQIAFALMIAIGLSWTGYATWVLARRRVLLAGHRIVAARMAVIFSAIFVAGFAIVAIADPQQRIAFAASGFGVLMLAVAIFMLVRARSQFAALTQRRRALEVELGRTA